MKIAGKAHGSTGGFSLIELLVVMVVIAITLSIAGPSMTAYLERTRTRRALDRLVSDVSFARLYAVQEGRRTAVSLQANGTYTIDTISTGGTWAPVRTVTLRNEYQGISISGPVTRLEFSSRGILSSQGTDAVLTVAKGSYGDSVFVSPAGRMYRDF